MKDKKSPEMRQHLDILAKRAFGHGRSECLENDRCVICGGDAVEFDNELSRKEYAISAMCQTCQNKVF